MAAAAASAGDPRTSTQAYLDQHQLSEVLEALLSELLYLKPADPQRHIVATLEKIKVAGSKPLLTPGDLDTVFSMFDITKHGTVTEQQACNALRTVLGSRAPQPGPAAAATPLSRPEFVSFCQRALCAATPLCQPAGSARAVDA